MNCFELVEILNRGEDSTRQFKENFSSIDNLPVEITAFANTDGGVIIVGVSDTGEMEGLSKEDIQRINQWISNYYLDCRQAVLYIVLAFLRKKHRRIILNL